MAQMRLKSKKLYDAPPTSTKTHTHTPHRKPPQKSQQHPPQYTQRVRNGGA